MKKFLINCVFFVIPIIFVAILIEFRLRQVPNPYKYKYEWMENNAEDVEILVLGSSHTYFGIRPEFFDSKAFSLANVSQLNEQDLFLLKYWGERYKHLKTVILPISLFSWFSRGLEYDFDTYRCRYYKIYMDCDLYPDWSQYSLELLDVAIAKKKYSKIMQGDTIPEFDQYGWGTGFKLSNKNIKYWEDGTEAAAAIKRHTIENWDYIGDNIERMQEIATFCKCHHLQLVLITTPCWHTYYDHLDQKQLTKMYELTRQFQQTNGLTYFDYLKDPRFVADDFFDSNHLSDIGAEKFTKILCKDIKSLP